ncbi:MAG: YbhB/YbcL family Raf kinase inhibitor-like protein [Caulobacteraceae bacterium]
MGPVAAALTGVITGALGGFAGSLIGAGVCETAALATEKQLAAGHAIIASLTTSGTSESPRRLTVRQTWSASTTVRFLLAGLVLLGACSARDRAGAAATQPGKAADLAIAAPQTQARGRLDVASSAFAPGAAIPGDYGAYGGKRSPPVRWSGGPAQAKSYVLIIEDPDAPTPRPFVHWVIYDIPAGAAVPDSAAPPGAREGRSTMMTQGYFPLAPPPGPAHHYHFQVFALDADLDLKPGASRDEVVKAMAGHVLARGDLVGLYRKP